MLFFIRLVFIMFMYTCDILANSATLNVGIAVRSGCKGEREFANRVKIAGKRLNWKVSLFDPRARVKIAPFSFVINLSRGNFYYPNTQNYLVLFDSNVEMIKNNQLTNSSLDYDGYLFTLNDLSTFEEQFEALSKPFASMSWYPTVQAIPYKPELPVKKITYLTNFSHINDPKLSIVLKLLDKAKYCSYYGIGGESLKNLFPNSYKGIISYDGNQLIETLQKNGIVLLLHREQHMKDGIPSGRIFEAVAASCVIISDMNPFIMEHFGESVLYFDRNQGAEAIFNQIDSHMKWIQKHPNEARNKAKRAHAIFEEKFILEDQLMQLSLMHEKVSS